MCSKNQKGQKKLGRKNWLALRIYLSNQIENCVKVVLINNKIIIAVMQIRNSQIWDVFGDSSRNNV